MTSTYWPVSHVQTPCHVPAILSKSSESFQQFYLSRHTGRQLTWQYGFGNADVHTQFRKEAHDLNVSTYALIILLLFQDLGDDDFLTYSVRRRHSLVRFIEGNKSDHGFRKLKRLLLLWIMS
jgi:cullin 3